MSPPPSKQSIIKGVFKHKTAYKKGFNYSCKRFASVQKKYNNTKKEKYEFISSARL